MNSIQPSSGGVQIFRSATAMALIENISATANNTAIVAEASRVIERNTEATAINTAQTAINTGQTASNTARMVLQQQKANVLAEVSRVQQQMQIALATEANEQLRGLDQTLGAVEAALEESNGLLKRSVSVQTELLRTIQAEHARLQRDRETKKVVYALERSVAQIEPESDSVVRGYAVEVVLAQLKVAHFSADDVFEVSDKRLFDATCDKMRGLIAALTPEEQQEVKSFTRSVNDLIAWMAIDPRTVYGSPKRPLPAPTEIDLEARPLPPMIGNLLLSEELVRELEEIGVRLAVKRQKLQEWRRRLLMIAGCAIVPVLLLTWLIPFVGVVLIFMFSGAFFLFHQLSIGHRIVGKAMECDMDVTEELARLCELRASEGIAGAVREEWDQFCEQTERNQLKSASYHREESQRVRRHNEGMAKFNRERDATLKAAVTMHSKIVSEAKDRIRQFIQKHPSIVKWCAILPESALS